MAIDPKKLSLREKDEKSQRLIHLHSFDRKVKIPGKYYTKLVQSLRLILPLIAISIIGLLMAWPSVKDTMEPIKQETVLPQTIQKNELINPRFQSEDSKKQPFTITAARAVQSAHDSEVVILEKPMADITLNNGTWIAAEAERGAYRQEVERLLLEGHVKLFHDQGYQLETEKLMVNMKTREAWSDVFVHGQGPAGTLSAQGGLLANEGSGILIFQGPVKLVLNRAIEGL